MVKMMISSSNLEKKSEKPELIATSPDKKKYVYRLGSIDDVDYGFLAKREFRDSDTIPDDKELTPVPSILKFDAYTEWEFQ